MTHFLKPNLVIFHRLSFFFSISKLCLYAFFLFFFSFWFTHYPLLFDVHFNQALLVSGGSDGLLVLWNADYGQDSRELVPKLSLKVFFSIFSQDLHIQDSFYYKRSTSKESRGLLITTVLVLLLKSL